GMTVWAQDDDDTDTSLPITEDVGYIIRVGDTLDSIGATFDVSPTCLAEENDITNPAGLFVGDVIQIRISCPRYNEDPRDNGVQIVTIPREVSTFEDDCEGYRVQRNDSLDLIAFELDIAPLAIAQANDLEIPYSLAINQCLEIPEDVPGYETVPALSSVNGTPISEADLESGGGVGTYVIQPNDVLDLVAQDLDVSLEAIIIFNDIENPATLTAGTVIFIPADAPAYGVFPAIGLDVSGSIYVIGEDDTIDSIAEEFDVARIAIEVANEIDSDSDLVPGETLTIPANAPAFGEDEDFDPSTLLGQGGGGELYVVQPRETLEGIAIALDVDLTCLLESNNITRPNLTQPGTVLVIDQTCPPYSDGSTPSVEDSIVPADDADEDNG
ncbi:MAG: LysM peptidoglycan-binding domain-containing protein, partial [Chloroflexota bacterium]